MLWPKWAIHTEEKQKQRAGAMISFVKNSEKSNTQRWRRSTKKNYTHQWKREYITQNGRDFLRFDRLIFCRVLVCVCCSCSSGGALWMETEAKRLHICCLLLQNSWVLCFCFVCFFVCFRISKCVFCCFPPYFNGACRFPLQSAIVFGLFPVYKHDFIYAA